MENTVHELAGRMFGSRVTALVVVTILMLQIVGVVTNALGARIVAGDIAKGTIDRTTQRRLPSDSGRA